MTNSQAKSELMQIYGMLSEEKKQAIDVLMAQADGEYISRKALLEDLYKRDYTKFTHRDFVALVQYQDIVAIPSAEPKTAHWIVHPKGIYAHLICDNCLSNAPYDCRTNYCPNCGFRMVEPQERSK